MSGIFIRLEEQGFLNCKSSADWCYQFPAAFLMVWGADMLFLCGILYASKIADHAEQAQAGSIISTVSYLGTSFVLAIATIVSDRVQISESAKMGQPLTDFQNLSALQIPRAALLKGYKAGWWTCFAFMAFAGLLSIVGMHGIGYVGSKKMPERQSIPMRDTPSKERVAA